MYKPVIHTGPGYCKCGCGTPTTIAKRTDRRWGWVKGQPRTWVKGHNPGGFRLPSCTKGQFR